MTTVLGNFLKQKNQPDRIWPAKQGKPGSRAGCREQRHEGEEILCEVMQILNQMKHRRKVRSLPGGDERADGVRRGFSTLADRSRMKEILAKAIGTLPKKEQMVLSLYYRDELDFEEVGEVLGVRPCSASRLFQRAMLDLMSEAEKAREE